MIEVKQIQQHRGEGQTQKQSILNNLSEFREYLNECGYHSYTVDRYIFCLLKLSDNFDCPLSVTAADIINVLPDSKNSINHYTSAINKYTEYLQRVEPYKNETIGKRKLDIIGEFCIKVIKERRRVSSKELRELCKKELSYYKIGHGTVGQSLLYYLQTGVITRWKSNGKRIYGFREEKEVEEKMKRQNRCNMCGKMMRPGPNFCRECEPQALKIVEQCFPCPIPPNYPGREV